MENTSIYMFLNIIASNTMILLLLFGYVFIGIGFFSFLLPQYYFSELFLSFLPYHIVISFLGLIIGIVFFRRFLKRKESSEIIFNKPILALLLLGLGILFLLFSRKFTSFYNFPVEQIKSEMTGGIKILYANIYKNNIDYVPIEELIKEENPDLILFVEFADHHYNNLKHILETNYPYSNSTIRSQKYVGNMVFSKKEINNRADDFDQGAWRYGYFSIIYNSQPIYFYLVHMSSPSNVKFFNMRNAQIKTFFKDFDLHKEIHRERNDKIVVIGDFNTSPRSVFYWKFAEGFNREFVNITRSLPILFTRKSIGFPLFWSHIDHIFANKLVSIKDLQIIDIPGSDHKGFSFEIK